MEPALRDLIHRLSPEGLERFCSAAGLPAFDRADLGPRQLTRQFEEHLRAPENRSAWQSAEVMAGEIKRLTAAADVCEEALRDTCYGEAALEGLVSRDAVIEDRALDLLIARPDRFQRACNLAMSLSLAEQKGHARFNTPPGALAECQVDAAAEAIKIELHGRFGGHRVIADPFELVPDETGGKRWHIAIYVGRAAMAALEISDEAPDLIRRVQKPVHEIGVSYNEASGQLDVSGRGIGGLPALREIAEQFGSAALDGVTPEQVTRHEWRLSRFKTFDPELPAPPPPFASVQVREICFGQGARSGGRSEHHAGPEGNVYDWLRRSGVSQAGLRTLQVKSVGLEFATLPSEDSEAAHVRMTLRWPNGRNFANETLDQARDLADWAVSGAFHKWCQADA